MRPLAPSIMFMHAEGTSGAQGDRDAGFQLSRMYRRGSERATPCDLIPLVFRPKRTLESLDLSRCPAIAECNMDV